MTAKHLEEYDLTKHFKVITPYRRGNLPIKVTGPDSTKYASQVTIAMTNMEGNLQITPKRLILAIGVSR